MGFPNGDKILQKMLYRRFSELPDTLDEAMVELFDDTEPEEQQEISKYILRKKFITDSRKHGDDRVLILPSFPMLNVSLPQIGISLGDAQEAETYMNDSLGESVPILKNGVQTGWLLPKGYWSRSTYNVDVVAATKEELIWLVQFVHFFVMQEKAALNKLGLIEISVAMADVKVMTEHAPLDIMARTVRVTCKVANTWFERLPVSYYETGVNLGI